MFEGAKVAEAPGWATGECKPRRRRRSPDVLDSRNMRAIGLGTQYADMVALVAEALKSADPRADIAGAARPPADAAHDHLCRRPRRLQGQLRELVVPAGLARRRPHAVHRHAPERPRRLAAGAACSSCGCGPTSCGAIDTLYLDIDLIRTFRVDDNEKTFFAEFYLSMRGNKRLDRADRVHQRLPRSQDQRPPDHRPHAARRRPERRLSRPR